MSNHTGACLMHVKRTVPTTLCRQHCVPPCRSFVDDVGAVEHPPTATLDFPISNDPQTYKQYQRRNFACQVDEATLAESPIDPLDTTAASGLDEGRRPQQDAKIADIEHGGCLQDSTPGNAQRLCVALLCRGGVTLSLSLKACTAPCGSTSAHLSAIFTHSLRPQRAPSTHTHTPSLSLLPQAPMCQART